MTLSLKDRQCNNPLDGTVVQKRFLCQPAVSEEGSDACGVETSASVRASEDVATTNVGQSGASDADM
jgi:hypothetical protein